jgi:hypothetical protein
MAARAPARLLRSAPAAVAVALTHRASIPARPLQPCTRPTAHCRRCVPAVLDPRPAIVAVLRPTLPGHTTPSSRLSKRPSHRSCPCKPHRWSRRRLRRLALATLPRLQACPMLHRRTLSLQSPLLLRWPLAQALPASTPARQCRQPSCHVDARRLKSQRPLLLLLRLATWPAREQALQVGVAVAVPPHRPHHVRRSHR